MEIDVSNGRCFWPTVFLFCFVPETEHLYAQVVCWISNGARPPPPPPPPFQGAVKFPTTWSCTTGECVCSFCNLARKYKNKFKSGVCSFCNLARKYKNKFKSGVCSFCNLALKYKKTKFKSGSAWFWGKYTYCTIGILNFSAFGQVLTGFWAGRRWSSGQTFIW